MSKIFDSDEEFEFNAWCEEAVKIHVLESFTYHPEPYKLSTRATYFEDRYKKGQDTVVEKFLLHPHEFTPDFKLKYTPIGGMKISLIKAVPVGLLAPTLEMVVDVKAKFSRFHDAKSFSINQKWVYSKYGIYIHKIIPEEWFKSTWVPKIATVTKKTMKIRKKYEDFCTMEKFDGYMQGETEIRSGA